MANPRSISADANYGCKPHTGEYDGFRYEVLNPSNATSALQIYIPAEKSVHAVPGCMLATSENIEIKGKFKESFKAMVGSNKARYQTLTAKGTEGWVLLVPSFYGSITGVKVDNEELCVGDNAFLASIGDIQSTSKIQPFSQALFSGHGLFVNKVSGTGVAFVCAVGSMMSFQLQAGRSMVVDNRHLVIWSNNMAYEMRKSCKSFFSARVSGEGIVAKLTGPGRICVQTRNPRDLAKWCYEKLMHA